MMTVEQRMNSNKTHHREKIAILFFLLFLAMTGLMGRLFFLMIFRSAHYSAMAEDLHERERTIKAARGNIVDANGTVIATNRTVCTISVIHNQIEEPDQVVAVLSKELGIEEDSVRKKVEKYSSREIIKTNVDKALGDQIRTYHLAGVKVDEDYKRYYPYDSLASKVLGFTGGDNQGIIGLEVKYEDYLKGMNGKILTMSDAAGIEIENAAEDRIEPIAGQDLHVSLDVNIQKYCEQAAYQVMENHFSCPGFRIVEDRKIRCHKVGGHGSETFLQGMMNSCNPVLIDVGQRLGVDNYYKYFEQFGLKGKTGIDLPGEAATIMHKKENMGLVELATVSFGQSFQITPMQLITTASAIVNGGNRVTPHLGVGAVSADGEVIHNFTYPVKEGIVSAETSETMRYILEKVVSEGSGKKAYLEGYRIGGKTATSEKLPRSLKKYISSFIGFAPADNPSVIALITIDEPQGIYYGGTIAAPVIADIFKNILPYLGIEATEEKTVSSFRFYS